MEQQLPSWLTDAIAAAGMTAYAEDLDRKFSKSLSKTPSAEPALVDTTPLH